MIQPRPKKSVVVFIVAAGTSVERKTVRLVALKKIRPVRETHLVLRGVSDETLGIGERDVGRGRAVALVIRDDLDSVCGEVARGRCVSRASWSEEACGISERNGTKKVVASRGFGFVNAPFVLPHPYTGVRRAQIDADGDIAVSGHVGLRIRERCAGVRGYDSYAVGRSRSLFSRAFDLIKMTCCLEND